MKDNGHYIFFQDYFNDNPNDLEALKHTRKSNVMVDTYFQDVPDYLSKYLFRCDCVPECRGGECLWGTCLK